MGFSRRGLLASMGAAGVVGLRARAEPPPIKLVVVVAAGGWDPTFTIDPRPEFTDGGPYPDLDRHDPYDVERIRTYGEIAISDNSRRRPNVGLFFDRFADRSAVVNGLWTGSLSHWQAMVNVLCGTTDDHAPDVAVAAGTAMNDGDKLACLDLSGVGRFGPYAPWCGRAGLSDQLAALLAPTDGWVPSEADREATRGYLDARASVTGVLGARHALERQVALDHLRGLRERGAEIAAAVPLGKRSTFADTVPMVEAALTEDLCHAVVTHTAVAWDTHADAIRQHRNWDTTFLALGDLCTRLDAVGMLDTTLIAVVSELGRSPHRNRDDGTDHWTYTSAVLVGAGIAGGRRVAGTDSELLGVGIDPESGEPAADGAPVTYASFAAGLLDAVGVDPEAFLPGVAPLRGFRA